MKSRIIKKKIKRFFDKKYPEFKYSRIRIFETRAEYYIQNLFDRDSRILRKAMTRLLKKYKVEVQK